jgi:hypothetical protein
MVGGNLPNHLRDFKEGITIEVLFSWGQCGPCVVLWKRRIIRGFEIFLWHSRLL